MRKIHLSLALMLFSAQASAEWELLNVSGVDAVYIDKSTIRKQGGYTAMWFMVDFFTIQKAKEGYSYSSAKFLDLYNCRDRTSGTKADAYYDEQMGLGKVVKSASDEIYQVKFADQIPDSIGEAMLDIACAK